MSTILRPPYGPSKSKSVTVTSPSVIAAATRGKAAEEKSPGTSMSVGWYDWPPGIRYDWLSPVTATPKSASMSRVIVTYGVDRNGDRISTSDSFAAKGQAMSRLERNWELTSPGRAVAPPRRIPRISTGGRPSRPRDFVDAPRADSARRSGPIGRSWRLAPPVNRLTPSIKDATPARRRSVVPEFPTSNGSPGERRGFGFTRSSSPEDWNSVPNAAML